MAKFIAVSVADASLDAIAAATEMYFCNGEPTTRANAIALKSTAVIPLTGADFSKANGGVAGSRVLTIAAKSANGTVAQVTDHIAVCSAAALLYVTTAPVQAVNVGALVSSAALTVTAGPLT